MFGIKISTPKIKISNPIKTVTKAIESVTKPISNVSSNVINEVNRTWENNKDGVNATAGLAARGAAAYYTLGASELVGGGNYLTNQFGGAKKTSQYGQLAGTIGGVAGVSSGLSSLVKAGTISGTTATLGTSGATSIIGQRASGNAVNVGRTIASTAGSGIDQYVGDNMESGFWENQWNQYGGQVVDGLLGNLLGGSTRGDSPAPVQPQQPVIVQGPSGGNDNNKMMLMLAGGLGLVTVLVLLRK